MNADSLTKERIIKLIKEITLPNEKTHWQYSNYGGESFKSPAMTENLRQFQIANYNNDYYLQIYLLTWYEKGPCDVPSLEVSGRLFFKLNGNKWVEISRFDIGIIDNDLKWENIVVN